MDDISQVVELEYKGTYYLLKGSKEFISYALKAIKAINDWGHRQILKKPGESSWRKIQEVSEGNAVILEFPQEMFEKNEKGISPFDEYVKKNKLRYCIMPDFNPNDTYVPVGVVSQDVALHQKHINEFMDIRVQRQKKKDDSYDDLIAKLKDKIVNARTVEERDEAAKELSKCVQAKQENMDVLKEIEEKKEKGNVLTFEEYLRQGEQTSFKDDPEKALKQEEICGMVMEYEPYECMYPIRDKDKIPKSKEVYYSQKMDDDTYLTIRRQFIEDDHGIIYSKYFVNNPSNIGEVKVFSDKEFNKEEWKKQLDEMLKKSGMDADGKTATFHTEDRLKRYMEATQRNFSDAPEEHRGAYIKESSKEVKEYINQAREEAAVRNSFEHLDESEVIVPSKHVMAGDNKYVSIEVEDGLIDGLSISDFNADYTTIHLEKDKEYTFESLNGERHTLTGKDALDKIKSDSAKREQREIAKTKGRG